MKSNDGKRKKYTATLLNKSVNHSRFSPNGQKRSENNLEITDTNNRVQTAAAITWHLTREKKSLKLGVLRKNITTKKRRRFTKHVRKSKKKMNKKTIQNGKKGGRGVGVRGERKMLQSPLPPFSRLRYYNLATVLLKVLAKVAKFRLHVLDLVYHININTARVDLCMCINKRDKCMHTYIHVHIRDRGRWRDKDRYRYIDIYIER